MTIRFGKWIRYASRTKVYERIYIKGCIWTPFVKVKPRKMCKTINAENFIQFLTGEVYIESEAPENE